MLRPDCTCVQAGLSMRSSFIDEIVFFLQTRLLVPLPEKLAMQMAMIGKKIFDIFQYLLTLNVP